MGGRTTFKSRFFKLNNLNSTKNFSYKNFSSTSNLRANIDKDYVPFELFYWSLDTLQDRINVFNTLTKELDEIIASNGGITIELIESNHEYDNIKSELFRVGNSIKSELGFANGLFDKIKLTYPNFECDKLLEYIIFIITYKHRWYRS